MIETDKVIILPFSEIADFNKEGFGWTAYYQKPMYVAFAECAANYSKIVPESDRCVAWRDYGANPMYFEFPGEKTVFVIFNKPEKRGFWRKVFRRRTDKNWDDFYWVQRFIANAGWTTYDRG